MKERLKKWRRKILLSLISVSLLIPAAHAVTDYNQIGKQTAFLLQSMHFSQPDFGKKQSERFLTTYLYMIDPSKIYFTQQDVDRLKVQFGDQLSDYLHGNEVLDIARTLHSNYKRKVGQRAKYALELLDKNNFEFDSEHYIPRSRENLDWPKDEEEMKTVWQDRIKSQMLDLMLEPDDDNHAAEGEDENGDMANSSQSKAAAEKLIAVYKQTLEDSKEQYDDEGKVNALLTAVARSLDPHTNYMGSNMSNRFKEEMGGSMVGIGVMIRLEEDGAIRITGLIIGGPADKSGELQLDDRIIGIDSNNTGQMVDIRHMPTDRVSEYIRGKVNSVVRMKVEPAGKPGEEKIVTITRKIVENKDALARGEIIDVKNGKGDATRLGVLVLPSFYVDLEGGARSSAKDVRRILQRMVKEKIKGLVFDMRGNGGGSLTEATTMAGFFLGKKPIVQVKDNRNNVIPEYSIDKKPLFTGPLVVLIDKESASSSELLAGAIQDYGRGVIVGDTSSFGKGTVQELVPVGRYMPHFSDSSRAGLLKVTTRKFYRVGGASTQLKGVESDIVIPSMTAAYDDGESTMKFAMPHDKISAVKGYKKDSWISSILPELKEKSAGRVAGDPDLQTVRESITLFKQKLEENKLSLNKAEREKEKADLEEKRKAIANDRKARFEKMALADAEKFKIFRLTLDDLASPSLVQADPSRDHQQFVRLAQDVIDESEDEPAYPSGLDPELRESLNIVSDMIELKASGTGTRMAAAQGK